MHVVVHTSMDFFFIEAEEEEEEEEEGGGDGGSKRAISCGKADGLYHALAAILLDILDYIDWYCSCIYYT